tara:strand:+ start:5601 stop:5852 length:252 start_codon:yes stop_codon:yes gene_type:complete
MPLTNEDTNDDNSLVEETTPREKKLPTNSEKTSSATTPEIPEFGWSFYAERINGRFAMIGFTAVLVIELFTNQTFLNWADIIH